MGRRGFTIIEVLAALTIFALAAIVLGAAYVNVLLGYQHAEQATKVDADVGFAREILFRLADLDTVEKGGDFETTDGRKVAWVATVTPTTIADLFDVEFEVTIDAGPTGKDTEVKERFRMLRPTWSEDDERDQLRQESKDRITEYLENRKP